MLTNFLKYIISLDKTGHLEPKPGSPLMHNQDMKMHSLEDYSLTRYRSRFTMQTPSIDEFARYFNDRLEIVGQPQSVNVFINTEEMQSDAVFNVYNADMQPDHCDDTAHCNLKALPVWSFLQSIGNLPDGYREYSQRRLIDVLRDWHDYIENPADLVQKFQRLTVDQVKNKTATREDFTESDGSLESISLKAEGGDIPNSIKFKIVPYEGFDERDVRVGIAASFDRSEKIALRVRVDQYEPIRLDIANEFAVKLGEKLNVNPYLGTFAKA